MSHWSVLLRWFTILAATCLLIQAEDEMVPFLYPAAVSFADVNGGDVNRLASSIRAEMSRRVEDREFNTRLKDLNQQVRSWLNKQSGVPNKRYSRIGGTIVMGKRRK